MKQNKKQKNNQLATLFSLGLLGITTALGVCVHELRIDHALTLVSKADTHTYDGSHVHHTHTERTSLKAPAKSPAVSGREQFQRKHLALHGVKLRSDWLPNPAYYI